MLQLRRQRRRQLQKLTELALLFPQHSNMCRYLRISQSSCTTSKVLTQILLSNHQSIWRPWTKWVERRGWWWYVQFSWMRRNGVRWSSQTSWQSTKPVSVVTRYYSTVNRYYILNTFYFTKNLQVGAHFSWKTRKMWWSAINIFSNILWMFHIIFSNQ